MELPGGLCIDGQFKRDYVFKSITGLLELDLVNTRAQVHGVAGQVTEILALALEQLGGEDVDADGVRDLAVGDRQYLMCQLSAALDDQPIWVTALCNQCDEPFEVNYRYSQLPVKQAGEHYPETTLMMSLGKVKLRVPTGRDQECIATMGDESRVLNNLIARIVAPLESSQEFDTEQLSDADLQEIEKTIEDMSPEVATRLDTECPHCKKKNHISIDPYSAMHRNAQEIYSEIHAMALNYHWSEHEILCLPRARRKNYLALIDKSRGMRGAGNPSAADVFAQVSVEN